MSEKNCYQRKRKVYKQEFGSNVRKSLLRCKISATRPGNRRYKTTNCTPSECSARGVPSSRPLPAPDKTGAGDIFTPARPAPSCFDCVVPVPSRRRGGWGLGGGGSAPHTRGQPRPLSLVHALAHLFQRLQLQLRSTVSRLSCIHTPPACCAQQQHPAASSSPEAPRVSFDPSTLPMCHRALASGIECTQRRANRRRKTAAVASRSCRRSCRHELAIIEPPRRLEARAEALDDPIARRAVVEEGVIHRPLLA
jgi:hypothetical protein